MQEDNEQLTVDSGQLTEQLEELNDKYLRTLAELENTRKRAALDIESAARGRGMVVAEQFLPLVDAIDKALELSPADEGIGVLKKAAEAALTKVGITRIETAGQILNPMFMNAIQAEESDLPKDTVVNEIQSGFMFGDTVLRTAMVTVAK